MSLNSMTDVELNIAKAIAVRLATEEVPLRVIARATKISPDEVRDVLEHAVDAGVIIQVPRDDWHPNPRGTLPISPNLAAKLDDTDLVFNCVRLFKVTRLQGSFLSVLIRRNEVSKEVLHQVIEQNRKNVKNNEPTDPKMVDVIICNLRKKLRPFALEVKTLWACGYYMEPDTRHKIQNMINDHILQTITGGKNG